MLNFILWKAQTYRLINRRLLSQKNFAVELEVFWIQKQIPRVLVFNTDITKHTMNWGLINFFTIFWNSNKKKCFYL
jgi:hypothetical protein